MLRPVCPPVPVSPSPPPSPRRKARSLLTWPLVTTVHPASPNHLLPYRPSPHYRGRVRLRYWPDHVILRFHLLGGFPRPWRRSPHSLPRGTSPTRARPPPALSVTSFTQLLPSFCLHRVRVFYSKRVLAFASCVIAKGEITAAVETRTVVALGLAPGRASAPCNAPLSGSTFWPCIGSQTVAHLTGMPQRLPVPTGVAAA